MINKERLLSTFLDYVQIDSESTHEGAMATRVAEDLKAIGSVRENARLVQLSFDVSPAPPLSPARTC